jgi:hypothetical protein
MIGIHRALWKPMAIWAVVATLVPATRLMAEPSAVAEQTGQFRIEAKPRLCPEAREATLSYRYQNFIPPAMRISDGYIDGGRAMKIHPDGQIGSSRELMIVDRRHDARLRKLLAIAQTPEIRSLDELERAVKLADCLQEFCNGSIGRSASAKAADSLAPDYHGRGVMIGDVVAICGGASCRHRTLLYKLLADEAGLSVSMVRGRYRHSDGRLGSHAWNELYLKNGTVLLVDIMSPPRDGKFPTIQEERPKKYLGPKAEVLYGQPHVVWPPLMQIVPEKGDRVTVTITPPASDAKVFHTVDGSEPTAQSLIYHKPLSLAAGDTVKTLAIYPDGFTSRRAETKVGEP